MPVGASLGTLRPRTKAVYKTLAANTAATTTKSAVTQARKSPDICVRRSQGETALLHLFPAKFGGSAFRQPFGHDSTGGLSKLVALLPNSIHIVHNWSEKGVVTPSVDFFVEIILIFFVFGLRDLCHCIANVPCF